MAKGSNDNRMIEDQRLKEAVLAYVSMRSEKASDASHQDLVRAFGPDFTRMMEHLVEEGLISSVDSHGQLTKA